MLYGAVLVPQAFQDPQLELDEMDLPASHDITNLLLFHTEAMERPFLLALRRICERFAINKTNSTDISAYHISARRENGSIASTLKRRISTNPAHKSRQRAILAARLPPLHHKC